MNRNLRRVDHGLLATQLATAFAKDLQSNPTYHAVLTATDAKKASTFTKGVVIEYQIPTELLKAIEAKNPSRRTSTSGGIVIIICFRRLHSHGLYN